MAKERFNIVLCGMGFMGVMHAQVYSRIPEARIIAVVDSNPESAAKRLRELKMDVPVFSDLNSALAAVNADVVDVCAPTDQHEALVVEACAAGKDVFCEKPIALDSASAARILKAVNDAGVRFQVGQCIRFWPEYRELKEIIDSKKAGRLLSLSLQRRSGRTSHSVGDWLNQEERSRGAVLDLHIHDTDYVLSLFGTPKAVSSTGTRDAGGLNHIFTAYHYDSGVAVVAEGGWNYPAQWGFQMAFQAVFENGTVEFDSGAKPAFTGTFGAAAKSEILLKKDVQDASSVQIGNVSDLGGYYNELRYFIDCLKSGKHPEIATGAQAAESLRVVEHEIESVDAKAASTIS